MTKKDYVVLARLIGENGIYINSGFVNGLIHELKKDNRRFNVQIFRDAINQHIKKDIKQRGRL